MNRRKILLCLLFVALLAAIWHAVHPGGGTGATDQRFVASLPPHSPDPVESPEGFRKNGAISKEKNPAATAMNTSGTTSQPAVESFQAKPAHQEPFKTFMTHVQVNRENPVVPEGVATGTMGSSVARASVDEAPGRQFLELAPGVQLPAILVDETPGRTPQIQEAKENLARSFEKELTEALVSIPAGEEKQLARAYHQARKRSDELYRALFGDAAYNNLGIRKATEAITADAATEPPSEAPSNR
ncbi:MAG: hypothetical protein ACKO2G_06825 [Verrucomicrobiales bacterium]